MNLPSTEELQRLLDEATPGEWIRHEEDGQIQNRDRATVAYADGHVHDDIELWIEWNLATDHALAALAPVLAAEVIRLRGGIVDAKAKLDLYVDTYHQQGHIYTSARLRDVSEDLTRILEGGQP